MQLEQLAKKYTCRLFSDLNEDDLRVSRLQGEAGLRHYVFKIEGLRDFLPLTIRINAISSEAERAKSVREFRVLSSLAGRYSPVIYDFDDSCQLFPEPAMCLQYVAGTIRAIEDLKSAQLEQLGRGLAGLHDMQLDTKTLEFISAGEAEDFTDYVINAIRHIRGSFKLLLSDHAGSSLVIRFNRALNEITSQVAEITHHPPFRIVEDFALLHGDLVNANIVWVENGGFTLIDWEDVRIGDPAQEIAYFFAENQIEYELRKIFWTSYAATSERDVDALMARTNTWSNPAILDSTLWWLNRYFEPPVGESLSPRFFLEGLEERLERLESE